MANIENVEKIIEKPTLQQVKIKKRPKSDLGDDFVAPDGGYAWIVCFSAGLSNLCVFSISQAFGLIFNDKFVDLKLSGAQITSITNMNMAVRFGTGMFDGELFRKFSFRQMALTGAILSTSSVFALAFATSFIDYLLYYSIAFGIATGFCVPSASLAINTYFKKKLRRARSYESVMVALGPIVIPYLVNFLLDYYGVLGTVICFSGICLHSFAFSMTYQPVKWHTKRNKKNENTQKIVCENCKNETVAYGRTDDTVNIRSNSLIEKDGNTNSSITRRSSISVEKGNTQNSPMRVNSVNNEKYNGDLKMNNNICIKCMNIMIETNEKDEKINMDVKKDVTEENEKKSGLRARLVKFFDLDLLEDLSFLNIMLGLTLISFSERNYGMLRVFFLRDFGFTKEEVAFILSTNAIADILVRFSIPIFTSKIKWDSRVFFSIGIVGSVICYTFISMKPSFEITVALFIIVGTFKAFKSIFMGLILPDNVPLKRLPAASGLERCISGLITIFCGPFIGFIKDLTNYSVLINILNLFQATTVLMWTTEYVYKKWRNKQIKNKLEVSNGSIKPF